MGAKHKRTSTVETNIAVPTTTTPTASTTTATEPLTSAQAFATRTAPLAAPATGPMTPGATYTATLEDGRAIKFLFQASGTGYIEAPFVLYGKLCARTNGVWKLVMQYGGTYQQYAILYYINDAGQKVVTSCGENPALVGMVL